MTTQDCRRCSSTENDPGKAKFFCAECPEDRRLLCGRCCGLEHHCGTNGEFHSVEEIDGDRLGIHVFSASLDCALLPGLLATILYMQGIPDDYLDGADVCPMVGYSRRFLAHRDPSVLYLLKTFNMPTSICGMEDGYIRLFYDAWVRTTVTGTDSWLLLFTTLPRALLFHFSFFALLTPAVALAYAVMSSCLYLLEEQIHRLPFIDKVSYGLQQFTDAIAPDAPPLTRPRSRPPKNFIDFITYRVGRRIRIFRHCYTVAGSRVSTFGLLVIAVTVVFRVIWLSLLGVGFNLQGHVADSRFSAASSDGLSNQLLGEGLLAVLLLLKGLVTPELVMPLLGLVPLVAAVGFVLTKQNQGFVRAWKERNQELYCGSCEADSCPCPCTRKWIESN